MSTQRTLHLVRRLVRVLYDRLELLTRTSHVHAGDIPGTVDQRTVEGDDTAYGQALYPVPTEDRNDPL